MNKKINQEQSESRKRTHRGEKVKQNKKPTYQELSSDKTYWKILTIIFFIAWFLFMLGWFSALEQKEEIKSQLNFTEVKDYACNNYQEICKWTFEHKESNYKGCAMQNQIEKCNKTKADFCEIEGFIIREEDYIRNITSCEVIK
jgi:hypothetical protein